jgi:ribosome-associated protein
VSIIIPEEELEERFVRASGPGGQNVNKVSTAVQLRFDVRRSPSLPDDVAVRLMRLAGSRMTQERNRADARARLAALVAAAEVRPVKRRATRPTRASGERRLAGKAVRAGVKSGRGRVRTDD